MAAKLPPALQLQLRLCGWQVGFFKKMELDHHIVLQPGSPLTAEEQSSVEQDKREGGQKKLGDVQSAGRHAAEQWAVVRWKTVLAAGSVAMCDLHSK